MNMTRHDDDRRTGAPTGESRMQGGHGEAPIGAHAGGQQQQYGGSQHQQGDDGGHGSFGGQAGYMDRSAADRRGERWGGGHGTGEYGRRSDGTGGYGSSTYGPEYAYGSGNHGQGKFDFAQERASSPPAYATYGASAGAWGTGFRDEREDVGGSAGWLGHHDADYARWRGEQLRRLDAEYADWRRERAARFAQEFDAWRSAREGGRAASSASDAAASLQSDAPSAAAGTAGRDDEPGRPPSRK
jgi:hypothetical protein